MNKIAIVYWSGTGNTEAMANAVLEGINETGAEGNLYTASEFSAELMDDYDAVAFACRDRFIVRRIAADDEIARQNGAVIPTYFRPIPHPFSVAPSVGSEERDLFARKILFA